MLGLVLLNLVWMFFVCVRNGFCLLVLVIFINIFEFFYLKVLILIGLEIICDDDYYY